jgi:hypothetical protein
VTFSRGTGDRAYGLVYVAPPDGDQTSVEPLGDGLAEEYGCVQQLQGGWWEFNSAGVMVGGVDAGCPFGVGGW